MLPTVMTVSYTHLDVYKRQYLDYPDSLEKALQLALSICPDTVRMPQWAKYQLNLHLGLSLIHI